jgi:3-phosphoshikimate 1-carboxyvinyltransferase
MGWSLSKANPMAKLERPEQSFIPGGALQGAVRVPGDKSISHRALMLSALAVGRSRIEGLGDGADVRSTAEAMRSLGALVERDEGGATFVSGVGVGGLLQPAGSLDMGNSGTSARLLMGLLASHPIRTSLVGDASLSARPMERVAGPLRSVGARIELSSGGRLPAIIEGVYPALPQCHRLAVASAQVKSALLLSALNTPGMTEVIEPVATRDHTERMLALFGARIERDECAIRLWGEAELKACNLEIPADPSSAAFLAVAALVVPGSEIRIENVCMNPRRTGLYEALRAMGGEITFDNERTVSGEPVADILVRHSRLRAIDLPASSAVDMIDEFPILFVAAAFAEGTTRTTGLGELRLKESDRIATMAAGLGAVGIRIEEDSEGLCIHGRGGAPLPGGATVAARMDHRIAMSFAVAGLHATEPVIVDDMSSVETSFPGFANVLLALTAGAQ